MALVLAMIMAVALANTATPVSAAQAGPAFPISWANIPDRDTFNQPQQGRASDDSYAVETGSDNCSVSYYGFGFSIPSTSVIDGIVITAEGQVSPGSDKGLDVSLSYDNGTSWTAVKNTGVMTTSDNFYTVGAADDNWGYSSWTPAIINSDYFRVRFDVSGIDGNIKIDSTQATVYYREGATTSVSSSGSSSTYGDAVTFTATVTRAGGADTPSGTVDFRDGGVFVGTGTLSGSDGTATATCTTSLLIAGDHNITAVYSGDSLFAGSTSLAITQVVGKKSITVTADAKSKVYGDSDPGLTHQITSGSLVSGDNFTGALTRVSGEAADTYAIQQGTLALSSNYNLTYAGAGLTVTVRPITVTADPQSKVYGDPDPALTYQITPGSLVSGDNFAGALVRVPGELAGTYEIQQGTLSLAANYNLTYVGASLTIAARPITITPPTPTLDGVGPGTGRAGETYDVIIEGSEFTGATNVDFGPDVTVNSILGRQLKQDNRQHHHTFRWLAGPLRCHGDHTVRQRHIARCFQNNRQVIRWFGILVALVPDRRPAHPGLPSPIPVAETKEEADTVGCNGQARLQLIRFAYALTKRPL